MNTKISQDLGWLSSIVPAISRQKSNQLWSGEHKRHSNSAHAMGMPRWWVTRCRPASWMRLRPQTIQIRYSSSVISAILGAVLGYLMGQLAGLLKPRLGRWVHKTTNVLNKVALSVQVNMKADLREIYGAPTRAAAEAAIDVFADKYGAKYDKAVACLTKDREALLAFFDFPAEHWDHLRTSNPIESVFATVRHRTVRTKGALSAKTAKLMVFKLVNAAAKTWRRLKGENQLPKVVQGVKFQNGIEVIKTSAHHAAIDLVTQSPP